MQRTVLIKYKVGDVENYTEKYAAIESQSDIFDVSVIDVPNVFDMEKRERIGYRLDMSRPHPAAPPQVLEANDVLGNKSIKWSHWSLTSVERNGKQIVLNAHNKLRDYYFSEYLKHRSIEDLAKLKLRSNRSYLRTPTRYDASDGYNKVKGSNGNCVYVRGVSADNAINDILVIAKHLRDKITMNLYSRKTGSQRRIIGDFS